MFNILIKILNCLAFFPLLKRVKNVFSSSKSSPLGYFFSSSHMSLKTKHRMTLLLRGPRISTWELSFLTFVSLEACTVSRTPHPQEEKSGIFLDPAILLRVLIRGIELSHRTVIYQGCIYKAQKYP